MTNETPVLSVAAAKKRFFIYLVLKLGALAAMFGGVFLSRGGITWVGGGLLVLGTIGLFLRPRMLGLTTRPEIPGPPTRGPK